MTNKIYATFDEQGFASGFYQTAAMSDPSTIPSDAVEVTEDQFSELFTYQGLRKWVGGKAVEYVPPPPPDTVPDSVSRRQFKMQLAISGLLTQVDSWISSQSQLVQIAYAESGSFLRYDTMMTEGFSGLGFTKEQIDGFFVSAAAL